MYRRRKAVFFYEVWAGGSATLVRAKDTGDIYGFGLNNFNQMGELGYKLSRHALDLVYVPLRPYVMLNIGSIVSSLS